MTGFLLRSTKKVICFLAVAVFEEQLRNVSSMMPTYEDLEGVVDATLRLQDTYQIPVISIVDGTFTPLENSPPMSGMITESLRSRISVYVNGKKASN